METITKKNHWDMIYNSKKTNEVSWFQDSSKISIDYLAHFGIQKNAKILDIGAGESLFVDVLLEAGYTDITVLDISEIAIEKSKARLGLNQDKVKWIVADFAKIVPTEKYDFVHDRAVFHFFKTDDDIQSYINTLSSCMHSLGLFVIATFSDEGPTKCSGIEIKQYTETSLENVFLSNLKLLKSTRYEHITPSGAIQKFIQASFIKKI
jgi:2-polyprenyl-3-methyl-5-hydroxy-6-metoxy-1,4-benzoquinol methylase